MSENGEHSHQKLINRKILTVDASPEVIFKAITIPEELTDWFFDQATFEPIVGSKVQFVKLKEKHPEYNLDKDYITFGMVKESIPNSKLAYTWKYENTPDFSETLVTWELEKLDSNSTNLKLTHSGFSGNEIGLVSFESHSQGWVDALEKLSKYCKHNRNK